MMPAVPSTSSKQFFVYAPGTEQAHTCIRLAGDMGDEGLRLINETNGTACTIHGPVHTLPPLAHLSIDSRLGQVILRQGEEKT